MGWLFLPGCVFVGKKKRQAHVFKHWGRHRWQISNDPTSLHLHCTILPHTILISPLKFAIASGFQSFFLTTHFLYDDPSALKPAPLLKTSSDILLHLKSNLFNLISNRFLLLSCSSLSSSFQLWYSHLYSSLSLEFTSPSSRMWLLPFNPFPL